MFEDEEEFDLAAIEARHAEMEAEENLLEIETAPPGEFPASDWEAIIEAVLFTMGNSVELKQLAVAIDQSEKVAERVVQNLQRRYLKENRGMQILELENAYQMCTQAKYYENLIRVAATPKKQILSDVVLETLSIIAYRQPVTKMEISKIRGVSSDHAVNRLVEYGLVYEAGRMDAPGRPALFATTEEFLRRFGVSSMLDLPTMNPEQEEEIRREVQQELQMQFAEEGEGAEPEEGKAGALTEDVGSAENMGDAEKVGGAENTGNSENMGNAEDPDKTKDKDNTENTDKAENTHNPENTDQPEK